HHVRADISDSRLDVAGWQSELPVEVANVLEVGRGADKLDVDDEVDRDSDRPDVSHQKATSSLGLYCPGTGGITGAGAGAVAGGAGAGAGACGASGTGAGAGTGAAAGAAG